MQDHSLAALKSARRLRQEMSLPEVLLWNELRGKPLGIKFRKQHPVGDFVLDFYCASQRIAIEIDGISHDMGDRPERDAKRDSWLKNHGIQVLRISASDVLMDVQATAEAVVAYCVDTPPPSAAKAAATSPTGGGFSGA